MEFNHKVVEGKGNQAISVATDPITDTIVLDATDNKCHLIVCDDLLVHEVVTAPIFELAHNSRRNVSQSEYRYFGWGTLLECSHRGFDRHGSIESKRKRDEGVNFGSHVQVCVGCGGVIGTVCVVMTRHKDHDIS